MANFRHINRGLSRFFRCRTLKEVRDQKRDVSHLPFPGLPLDGDPLLLVDVLTLMDWMDKVNYFLVGLVKVVTPDRWKQPVSDTERP